MSIFDFFRKKGKTGRGSRRRTVDSKQIFQKFSSEIQNLQSQTGTINIILNKHDEEISQHKTLIEKHTRQLDTLEQLVAKQPVQPANIDLSAVNRSDASISLPVLHQRQFHEKNQKFDIAQFSEQEKRILSVFFQNKDMALSYVDIGKYLGKSSNTIKNQLRQIILKADPFNFTIGNESRKMFKLKDGLRIEKYLNIDQPSNQLVGIKRLS